MKLNRRNFLTMGGVLGGGYLFSDMLKITQKIAEGVISNSYAQSLGVKKVLNLFILNAPPTWMFNQCLYPDAENIPADFRIEGVGTGFDSNGNTVFTQHKKGDYWFPKMWFTPIPTTSGLWVSPESLLESMLTVRGIWNPSDGHTLGIRSSFRNLGASYSLPGMVADAQAADYPIPSITTANATIAKEFVSPNGLSTLNSGNATTALNAIKDSFKEQVSLFRGKAIDSLVTDALDRMSANSEFRKASSNFNRKKADELIRTNLSGIVTDFNTIKAKYISLIQQACKYNPADANTHLPELFDLPLNQYSTVHWTLDDDATTNRKFQSSADLRELFLVPIVMDDVAEAFAMTEVLFENNLTANINATINKMVMNSPLLLKASDSTPLGSVTWFNDDGHRIGLSTQTLLWSVYFRGFITCLYEFISVLKANDTYKDTFISLSSDFCRSPFSGVITKSHSDHGWRANAVSMWSGCIKAPTIIGETMLDAKSVEGNNYKNLWGVGRSSPMLKNYIGLGNVQATMASIIGVSANTTNNKTLVEVNEDSVVPLETPKTT